MNRSELKEYVMQTLLEVVDYPGRIKGTLTKKTLGYMGVEKEFVCEGTIGDANQWAIDNKLTFVKSDKSTFGGHYDDGTSIYEFHPNPEYYGELMETDMAARDQLARISGTNDQILNETNSQVTQLVQHILTSETLAESRVAPIFSNITTRILEGLVDPTQTTRLLSFLVKEGVKSLLDDEIELSEEENKMATEQLFVHLQRQIEEITTDCENCIEGEGCEECTTEESNPQQEVASGLLRGGILAKNYNRLVGDHRNFL
jgi:hypothetical protein